MRATVEIHEESLIGASLDSAYVEWQARWPDRDVEVCVYHRDFFSRSITVRAQGDDEAVRDLLAILMPLAQST